MKDPIIFHLAIPINDIKLAKTFYCVGLGCRVGRENTTAIIFNFWGHQVVAHMTPEPLIPPKSIYPRHFGLIFSHQSQWEAILARGQERELSFYQQPKVRFPGQLTEHRTFFLQDPFYNLLEFKWYRHSEAIFSDGELTTIGDPARPPTADTFGRPEY